MRRRVRRSNSAAHSVGQLVCGEGTIVTGKVSPLKVTLGVTVMDFLLPEVVTEMI
jgi:hypothetical protein